MNWNTQQNEIDHMILSVRQRGYPLPHIYMSDWGYKRCFCDECGKDCLLRGYVKHYEMAHARRFKVGRPKKKREQPARVDDMLPVFDQDAWNARAKESHDRILKRFVKSVL